MKEKILIVDDEPNMLKLLGLTLEHEGYEIAVAQDAEQAMAKVQAQKPDLVILDVMLPRVSGLELCQQLRDRPDTANLPIIMLSAKGEVPDKVAGLKAGADEYVVKPVDTAEFLARVASLLERVRRFRAEQPSKAGKVISFIGAKGGVGTTTTVLNLGVAAAMQGSAVVAVEFRPYLGSFPVLLGLPTTKGLEELLDMEPGMITAHELSRRLSSHSSGLQVLCAPRVLNPEARIDSKRGEAILEGLAGVADYVLVDLPAHPSPASQTAIRCSRRVFLVVEPVRDCIEAGCAMAAYLKTQASAGTDVRVVIVNRAQLASPTAPGEIQTRLGCQVAGAIPPAADECSRAQHIGSPLTQCQPEAFASQAFRELVRALG
jgi:CheY-like chemotaxis protein/MinD-like ATPase involved in chromosome partitioning or flagellar assembly